MEQNTALQVVNGETGAVAATIGAPVAYAGATLGGLAVNPVNKKVYLGNDTGHTLEVINGATGATPAGKGPSVAMTGTANPGAVAVDSSSNQVIVNDPADNRVYI